jgi:hypothetical protein
MKPVLLLMVLAMLSLTGCAGDGPPPSKQLYCDIAKPTYLDKGDILTKPTLRKILGDNEVGAKICGWKAPGK